MQIYAPLTSEALPLLQRIEIASSLSIPSFYLIGLPSPEVAEAKERVRSAVEASGFKFPRRKIVVNLSPASIRKRGTGIDLAIALSVLSIDPTLNTRASSGLELEDLSVVAWAELGLDGTAKPVGQLTRVLYAAWSASIAYILISRHEFKEARSALKLIGESGIFSTVKAPRLIPIGSLKEAWSELLNPQSPKSSHERHLDDVHPFQPEPPVRNERVNPISLLPITEPQRRLIAGISAGQHHSLFLGPKGIGKSQSIEWLVSLKQKSSFTVRLHRALLAELHYFGRAGKEISNHPSRISTQVRPAALLGSAGSSMIRPGVFTLAHGDILVADELPEWHRDSREALREPLETGKVQLTRAEGVIEMPARFQLAATGNLCGCGGWPPGFPSEPNQPRCRCTVAARRSYSLRLSGPVLDRIDVVYLQLGGPLKMNSSRKWQTTLEWVDRTREILVQSWGNTSANLNAGQLEDVLAEHPQLKESLKVLEEQWPAKALSLRSRHKTLRLALTFAALDGGCIPSRAHFTEAAQYRAERLSQWLI